MIDRAARVYVAGHRGLVGGALVRALQREGFERVIVRERSEVDLTDPRAVDRFFADERPEHVLLAAAKVGGIRANDSFPADFGRDNLLIETHVLDAAHRYGVKKLLFLGSSCIYPKHAPQPLREEYLLTGPLEPTNEAYAIAKIAGIVLCRSYNRQHATNFVAAMPTNLYGPGDNFDLNSSHVLPALIRRFHEAKMSSSPSVELWGTGTPRREFLHVDDLARACVFLMDRFDWTPGSDVHMNVGTGEDVTIAELAGLVGEAVDYRGEIRWNTSMPDGTPRKVMDVSRIRALGWEARIGLREGIKATYLWYLEHRS